MNQVRALYAILVLSLAGMGTWVWKLKDKESTAAELMNEQIKKARSAAQSAVAQRDHEHEQAMTAANEQRQKELQALNADYEKKLDALRKEERTKLSQAYEQFSHILDGDKKTLDYINLIEKKIKGGDAISKAEAEKLAVIATGLTYLQKQYRKPFEDFGELETYLAKRANANIGELDTRNAFWKRMFSREYREKEREYYRNEGEKRGFQEANTKFTAAYAAAQKQMANVDIDGEKIIAKLNDVIQEKKTNSEDLTEFFNQARKALSTHQKLLEFEPDTPKPAIEGVKPQ